MNALNALAWNFRGSEHMGLLYRYLGRTKFFRRAAIEMKNGSHAGVTPVLEGEK